MSRHFHAEGIECYRHPHYFEKADTKKAKKEAAAESDTKMNMRRVSMVRRPL